MPEITSAADFPASTRADWLAAVETVLKGQSAAILRSPTAEGFEIEPIYERARGRSPIVGRPAGQRWSVVQRVDHPDVTAANSLLLADLEGGADGLSLVFAGSAASRGHGIAVETAALLDRVLDKAMLDILSVRLDAGRRARAAAALWMTALERRGLAAGSCRFSVGYDPIGILASRGRLSADWPVVERRIVDTVVGLAERGHTGPVLTLDGRPFHEAGASRSIELGAMLASGVAYLRALERAGLPPDQAARSIDAVLTADTDAFMTIAAFRALRVLWARVGELAGLPPRPLSIHAETAWRAMASKDPWSNMLRGTIAAFAAGVGGADSVTILPFTAALGLPDAFARRVARNAQHVLMGEAQLHRLSDPAAGSGAFEALTDSLAEQAWSVFQSIEREGGIVAALQKGFVQALIVEARTARPKAVVVGITKYPDANETPVAVLDAPAPALSARARPPLALDGVPGSGFAAMLAAAAGGATLGDLSATTEPNALRCEPLLPVRDGEGAP